MVIREKQTSGTPGDGRIFGASGARARVNVVCTRSGTIAATGSERTALVGAAQVGAPPP